MSKVKKAKKLIQAAAPKKPVWFLRGASRRIKAFAAVKRLGPAEEAVVLKFEDAYSRYLFGKKPSVTLKRLNKYAKELEAIIQDLPPNQKKICNRELQMRYMSANFKKSQVTKDAIEALKQFSDELAKKGVKSKEEVEMLQSLVASTVISKGSGKAFLNAFRKFSDVIAPDHPDLLKAFAYIKNNPNIRTAAGKSYESHINNLKGILFEAYASHSIEWSAKANKLIAEAEKAAETLEGKWTVKKVTGGMMLQLQETWDEAVLIVKESEGGGPPLAILYSAAQFKAEKRLTALNQTLKDIKREVDSISYKTMDDPSAFSTVLSVMEGDISKQYHLVANSNGIPSKRFVVNAESSSVSSLDEMLLKNKGVRVDQLEMDITADGMKEIAEAFIKAVFE